MVTERFCYDVLATPAAIRLFRSRSRSFSSAAGFGAFSSEGKDLEAPVMPDGVMDIAASCSRVARPSHGLHTVLDCVLRQDELIACRILDRISSRNLFGMRKAHQRRRALLARLKPKVVRAA